MDSFWSQPEIKLLVKVAIFDRKTRTEGNDGEGETYEKTATEQYAPIDVKTYIFGRLQKIWIKFYCHRQPSSSRIASFAFFAPSIQQSKNLAKFGLAF